MAPRKPEAEVSATSPEGLTTDGMVTTPRAGSAVHRLRLLVTSGNDAGTVKDSPGQRMVIGTHESCDLVLRDPTVSRFHCELVLAGDRPKVHDLGSRNGTTVDGVSVVEAFVCGGSVLTLGRTQLQLAIPGDLVPVPLSEHEGFGIMVGRSVAMRRTFARLESAAASESTLLLEGETGTGKEAAAESVHRESARADGPFIIVDCGAVPRELLESELFGHERGAFTGATDARVGAFEAAHGGTLFLDEIGELAPELQPKLLRALERREVKRVGANRFKRVDVRVIAATNRSLRTAVNEHSFRSDLYYRLAVLEVVLPPLRDRREDLPLLVDNLLHLLGAADRPEAQLVLREDTLAELARHHWPGNVRELRNYVERSLALRAPEPLPSGAPSSAAGTVDLGQPFKTARDAALRGFERAYLAAMLARHDDNVSAAARAAGLDRIQFYRLLWRNQLR
jgi:transcriptional regulator with PAS, ATPase and Fis domain